jgi:hypothetical protein
LLGASQIWKRCTLLRQPFRVPVVGKLVGQAVAAVNAQPGRPGRLCALLCDTSKLLFLVDTGAVYSVLPYSSTQPANGPAITSASGAPIACWGWKQLVVVFGGRRFKWSFLLAAFAFPLLGADFLEHFALTVNLKEYVARVKESPPIKLVAPPAGSANALVGVRPAAGSCSSTSALHLRLNGCSSPSALQQRQQPTRTAAAAAKPAHRAAPPTDFH